MQMPEVRTILDISRSSGLFLLGQLQEFVRDKARLSVARDQRSAGDGCSWGKENAELHIHMSSSLLSLNFRKALNTYTDIHKLSCTKAHILEQGFPDSICYMLMSV